jgi:hypothetical protein
MRMSRNGTVRLQEAMLFFVQGLSEKSDSVEKLVDWDMPMISTVMLLFKHQQASVDFQQQLLGKLRKYSREHYSEYRDSSGLSVMPSCVCVCVCVCVRARVKIPLKEHKDVLQ